MWKRYIFFLIILVTTIFCITISPIADVELSLLEEKEVYLIGGYCNINGNKYLMGDVSLDDKINSRDALVVLKHCAALEQMDTFLETIADVNSDERVTASDALTILKYSANIFLATDSVVHIPAWINSENASEYSVEGNSVAIENLNGAKEYNYDTNGVIYEFTEDNKNNNAGIEIKNPIMGNNELIHDYGYIYDINKEGLINAFHLYGSKLGWNRDEEKLPDTSTQLPSYGDPRLIFYPDTREVYYHKSDIHKGFSMSFWSKADYNNATTPIVVFADEKQTLAITLNGAVNYVDSVVEKNRFIANQNIDKPNYISGNWHYYTITFANDWICLYIDGVEVVYDEIVLDRKQIGGFNDGFLTRYNTAVTWTQEDYDNDWRGYLSNQVGTHDYYPTITSDRYTVWGNSRYRGLNAGAELLLTFMTNEATKVYIGGADVDIAAESAIYASDSGQQVAQIEYYLDELNWEQVYANYLLAKEPVENNYID